MTKDSRVIGYVRVSTEDQGESGAGLESQREAIVAECERRGWQLVAIEEDVLSGRDLRRPGLLRALDECRQRRVDGIVVAKLDRLSRSLVDFAGLLMQAREGGWNVVALDLGVDLSTPHGEFLANVMASAAQWERRIIGQRTRDALAVKRAQGVKLGRRSTVPTEVEKRIRRLKRRGLTFDRIAQLLNADSVPTPSGGEGWTRSNVFFVHRRVEQAA
jgi:DNA invertase Pin-like site-specific DNA recombinase